MSRSHLLAATAALLLAVGARAAEAPAAPLATTSPGAAAPGDTAAADARVEALVKQAVDKARQDLRDELRAELQAVQSASEFLGAAAEGPRLQFFELDGYLRARADLLDNLALRRGLDSNLEYLVPGYPGDTSPPGTQTSANLRLRLEPTLNVSEHIRARAQIDVLDNYLPGTSGQAVHGGAAPIDRPAINVKQVWGEVETPVGLLSFGRMPSSFGLGLVASAANGLDDDLGDSRDRIQFATLPLATPTGQLNLVTFIDFDQNGPLGLDRRVEAGAGQPINLDNRSNGRTWGLKLLKLQTEDELRRALERGETSTNFGLMYTYSTLSEAWDGTAYYHRGEYRHQGTFWLRVKTSRLHLEAETSYLYGNLLDPGPYAEGLPFDLTRLVMRQAGGVLRATYQVKPNKVTLGGEFGIASGDGAAGFGNRPGQLGPPLTVGGVPTLPLPGALEGPQYGRNGDRGLYAFQFNPGYRIDLILWREILGAVTDAFYLKPTIQWDILAGLKLDAALIYSQAMSASSTPSAINGRGGHAPLGVELDGTLTYATDDGFSTWFSYGVLFPLDGFGGAGSLTRAHAFRSGVAIAF